MAEIGCRTNPTAKDLISVNYAIHVFSHNSSHLSGGKEFNTTIHHDRMCFVQYLYQFWGSRLRTEFIIQWPFKFTCMPHDPREI